MKQFSSLKRLSFILLAFLLFSCASREKMAYYQNIESVIGANNSSDFELTLQPDDMVRIVVMGDVPEVLAPFNKSVSVGEKAINATGQDSDTYLIDKNGFILFPVVGKIKLGGLTKTQAETELNSVLREYIKKPSVNLALMNFKVTVQGEVGRPGIVNVVSERLTLPEALSISGDLTIFGRRENIMIVRESNGKKTVERVDITKADFINSPYYYLAQNDLIYVEPNKAKMGSSRLDPNFNVILSSASLLITIIVLIVK